MYFSVQAKITEEETTHKINFAKGNEKLSVPNRRKRKERAPLSLVLNVDLGLGNLNNSDYRSSMRADKI